VTCDSPYLVDRQINLSPKLRELEGILDKLVVLGGRKVVIFSQWTTMFFRIGQKSRCINVVNLITKNSIEEKILAGINLKTALFDGVFEGATDTVEFSRPSGPRCSTGRRGIGAIHR
jgi:SNF2 family DNA or RNA helicase